MTFFRTYIAEFSIALLALGVHLLCFVFILNANEWHMIEAVRGDDGYFELAQNVLAGNGFSWSPAPPYAPNPLRTPGYIYVLAGLFAITGSVVAAAFIQLLAASALPVFGMWIAQRITRSARAGILTGVILALDPTLALLSFQFFTETLFLLLFFPCLLLMCRYLEDHTLRILLLSALLLGCAILTKTSAQYVPLLFVPFIFWCVGASSWRRGLVHTSAYLLVIGAVLTPWIIRNTIVFGQPGLSAQAPFVLYTNLAPAVLSVAEGTPFAEEVRTFLTPAEFKGDAITLQNGDAYSERAIAIISAHPLETGYVAARSLFTFFTNDGLYTLLTRGGYTASDFLPLLVGARLIWVAITCSALVGGMVYLYRERTPLALLMVVLIAYFALTSTMAAFGTNPRYRLPVDPAILAFAILGVLYVYEYSKSFRNKSVSRQSIS